MVFNTRSGRPVGSRWAAKCRVPTARVEGAILFRSPERGDPVSGARVRGLLSVAESALTTKVGSSTRGPPIAPCDPVPWYAWRPVEAGRSGGMQKGGGWASRGPTCPCPSNNKLGSESCLWRRKGLLLPCQRSSGSSEPPADGASTPLRGNCSEITYLLLGSDCPAGVLPSASAGWAEPIPEGALPE